jgi:hypothetical protein
LGGFSVLNFFPKNYRHLSNAEIFLKIRTDSYQQTQIPTQHCYNASVGRLLETAPKPPPEIKVVHKIHN